MSDSSPEAGGRPIVCTLEGRDMRERFKSWAAIGKRALVKRHRHPAGVTLHYRRRPEVEAELRRLASLERDCCSSLAFSFTELDEDIVLTVSGPPEAASLIQECWGMGPHGHIAQEGSGA